MVPFVAAVIALCPIETRADTIALSFTPSGQTFITGNGTDTFGWSFTMSSPLTVTQLGVWDENDDGLGQSHIVTVWDSTGTVIEAQTTVPSGTTAPLTSGVRYVTLTKSVALAAGTYTIGALFGPSSEGAAIVASAIGTASGVTYLGSRAIAGDAFPPSDAFAPGTELGYFGPNFQFTTSTSVPDAGTTGSLFGLSLMGLAFLRRKLC